MKRREVLQPPWSRIGLLTVSLLLVAGVGSVAGQPPDLPPMLAVPFDPHLQVGATYTCQHQNVETGEVKTLAVQPLMVAFAPHEEVTLEEPPERVMSDLTFPEPGEWMPIDDTWELRLVVRDDLHRLGHAEVLNWATQSLIVQFNATTDGEWIDGTVDLDVDDLDQQVDIYPRGPELCSLRLRGGDVQYADVQWGFGFVPNVPPPDGVCPLCPDPPVRGDPYDVEGKQVTLAGGNVGATFCDDFANNNPVSGAVPLLWPLVKRKIVWQEAGAIDILAKLDTPGRRDEINAALNREDGTLALLAGKCPPFSQGRAFWAVHENGNIVAFVGIPHRKDRPLSLLSILGAVATLWEKINHPKFPIGAVAAAILNKVAQEHANEPEIITPLKGTKFIAATWAVDAQSLLREANGDPTIGFHEIRGYTQQVTFRLLGDNTPNGPNQPIGGSIYVGPGEAWTNPAPGGTGGVGGGYRPVDPATGSVTISLTHGFRYQVTAQPTGNYRPPAQPCQVLIPCDPNVFNIICTFQPMNPPPGGGGG